MQDRILAFEGIHNFRDYGGYAAQGGARLKAGLLFRSGQHADATPDDLEKVAKLELATVIDLRGDSERALHPCPRPEGFAARILFAGGETAGNALAPHIQAAQDVKTADEAHAAMVRLYAMMPFRPMLCEIFTLYFRELAERDGASLLHCLAGKDRTGLAAALLHRLLGVHDDDMLADYLLTNTAGDPERRIAAARSTVRSNFGPAMDDAALRTLMSVHPEYLETAFGAIEGEYGSVESYMESALGVSSNVRNSIESRLLA